jgi:DNA-binding NarL/FixJ family response regulator
MTTAQRRSRPERHTPEHFAGLSRMPSPGRPLTWRERRVLAEIALGLTNDQIARQLGYAPGTVSTMIQRILRKLDAPSRAAAVDRGWRLGYLGDDNVRSKGRVIR